MGLDSSARKTSQSSPVTSAKNRFSHRLLTCACCPGLSAGGRRQHWSCGHCSRDQAEDGCRVCPSSPDRCIASCYRDGSHCQRQMNSSLGGFLSIHVSGFFFPYKIIHLPSPNVYFLPPLTFLQGENYCNDEQFFPCTGIDEYQSTGLKTALCIKHYVILTVLGISLLPISQRSRYSPALGAPVNI